MPCVESYERVRRTSWEVFPVLDVWVDDSDYVEVDRRRRNCLQENLLSGWVQSLGFPWLESLLQGWMGKVR